MIFIRIFSYKSIYIKNKLCKKDCFEIIHESTLPFTKDANFMCLEWATFLPDLEKVQISIA